MSVTFIARKNMSAFFLKGRCIRSSPIYCTRCQRIGTVTNRPTPGFLVNTTTPPQAVWACSSGCSLRGPHVLRAFRTYVQRFYVFFWTARISCIFMCISCICLYACASDMCSINSTHVRYEHPLIASLLPSPKRPTSSVLASNNRQ